MKVAAVLAACLVAGAALAAGERAPAAQTPVPTRLRSSSTARTDGRRWRTRSAANQTPCANYYVVLTAIGDKTKPRGRAAVDAIHAKGPNFHALAEFNVGAWSKAKPASWAAKGRLFRQRMASAGYASGDTWAINELSSATRTKPVTQSRMRDAMRGLYTGPRGATPQQGAVFVVGIGQQLVNFGLYKAPARGLAREQRLVDGRLAVRRLVESGGVRQLLEGVRRRSEGRDPLDHLNEYVEHPARLAFAGPAPAVPARALFDRAYFPLMTAYWRDAKGYGNNRVSLAQMQALTNLEVYAARAWAIRNPYPDGRIGFAWNEHPAGATPAQVQALATRLAQSISGAYGDGGTATKACSPTGTYAWCKATLGGARFNPGWATFASW